MYNIIIIKIRRQTDKHINIGTLNKKDCGAEKKIHMYCRSNKYTNEKENKMQTYKYSYTNKIIIET